MCYDRGPSLRWHERSRSPGSLTGSRTLRAGSPVRDQPVQLRRSSGHLGCAPARPAGPQAVGYRARLARVRVHDPLSDRLDSARGAGRPHGPQSPHRRRRRDLGRSDRPLGARPLLRAAVQRPRPGGHRRGLLRPHGQRDGLGSLPARAAGIRQRALQRRHPAGWRDRRDGGRTRRLPLRMAGRVSPGRPAQRRAHDPGVAPRRPAARRAGPPGRPTSTPGPPTGSSKASWGCSARRPS